MARAWKLQSQIGVGTVATIEFPASRLSRGAGAPEVLSQAAAS